MEIIQFIIIFIGEILKNINEYGRLIYDSHPNNDNLLNIWLGIFGIIILIFVVGQQINLIENIFFIVFEILLTFSVIILFGYWNENNNNRIKILEKGIVLMNTIKPFRNPFQKVATGKHSGKRVVKYKDIIAIFYFNPWTKENKTLKIGLQIILPKEENKPWEVDEDKLLTECTKGFKLMQEVVEEAEREFNIEL